MQETDTFEDNKTHLKTSILRGLFEIIPYNSKLYSRSVPFLFLAVVALLEQIQCIWIIILVLVSLKKTSIPNNIT